LNGRFRPNQKCGWCQCNSKAFAKRVAPLVRTDFSSIIGSVWAVGAFYVVIRCRDGEVTEYTSSTVGCWDGSLAAHIARRLLRKLEGQSRAEFDGSGHPRRSQPRSLVPLCVSRPCTRLNRDPADWMWIMTITG
jgi:hypothetical protein